MAAAAPSTPTPPSAAASGSAAPASPSPAAPPLPLTGSLRTTGASRVPGVRALDWVARGVTKVVGDVEIGTGHVTGSLAVGGKVSARQLDLSGSVRVDGEIRLSEDLHARGSFRTGASVRARSVQLSGTVEIGGAVTVEELLRWSGTFDVGQDVQADEILFQGRLTIKGTLTARAISGEVEDLSSVAEIRADWVEIRRRKARFTIFLLPPPPWHELEVQRIEAKEVHLAGVRVRYLKADRIFLGPDSHIEYVEGTIIQRHKDAHVGPESESPPPYGLSR
jgi:cytoskeletal protein CcmA (bactofilin family)